MQFVENTSQRPITLTLRPGSLSVRDNAGSESAKVTLPAAMDLAGKPIAGASARMTLADMAKRSGVDVKDIASQLSKSKTIAALVGDGTIRVG